MALPMTVDQAKASVRQLEKVCSLRPTVPNLVKLSNCYFMLGDLEAAIPLAETAQQKEPNNPQVNVNMALLWKEYGDHDSSFSVLKMIVEELETDDPFILLAYAESLLRKGDWEKGWPIYNKSRQSKDEAALLAGIPYNLREWNGKKITQQLAVLDEGGFGDSITFSRYLPFLTDMGIDWIYFPFPELRGFYERASWCGPNRLANSGDKINVAYWTTTQSLPAILNVTPNSVPRYPEPFRASSHLVNKYKLNYEKKDKPVLGLAWSNSETKDGGRRIKSMSEGQAIRLICRTDHKVYWVNLSRNNKLPEPALNIGFSTLEEQAALMMNLDHIVAVESGSMCLAHALGKDLSIVLSTNSDWRFLDSGGSPFYPGATIFRNQGHGGVEDAITQTIEYVLKNWDNKKRLIVVG